MSGGMAEHTSLRDVRISRAHWDELVAHAREEAPNECCGYLRARDDSVEQVFRAENERKSPYGYELDHHSLFAANELDDAGYQVAIYHSHPRSAAEPSQTDINLANYPHWTYWIVSLDGEPHIRAWRIANGSVEEERVELA
jgi:proteasome lid subunit RPN8/RPN11